MADAIMEERPLNEMTPIHPLPAGAYKQEEIDWLCALADQIPAKSYLAGLITPNLINWFASRVKNDISADLWAMMRLFQGNTHTLATDLAQAEARTAQLSELADAWQQRGDKLGQLNDCLGAEVVDLKAKLYDYLMADLAERNGEEVNDA